jgi:hypothetical protein
MQARMLFLNIQFCGKDAEPVIDDYVTDNIKYFNMYIILLGSSSRLPHRPPLGFTNGDHVEVC